MYVRTCVCVCFRCMSIVWLSLGVDSSNNIATVNGADGVRTSMKANLCSFDDGTESKRKKAKNIHAEEESQCKAPCDGKQTIWCTQTKSMGNRRKNANDTR